MDLIYRNKRRVTAIIVVVLLGLMFGLFVAQARDDSGTTDEVAHIPAGYSYVDKGDYRLNPEHPPLAKALAGIPLLFLNLKGPYDDWSWKTANQWEAGWNFIYEQGNNADLVLFWSRLPIVILALALGLTIFFWAKSLYGRKIALFVLLLYSLSPTFLAHGHLVTTDVAATVGFTIGVWSFVNFLNKKTRGSLVLAGVMFGIAQCLKFSCFLLIPILFLILVAKVVLDRKDDPWLRNFGRLFGKSVLVFLIGLVVIWAIYTPFVWNMSPEVEHKVIEENMSPQDEKTEPFRNFLHKFEGNRLTRPIGHYGLGLFYIFGRTAGGNDTFIMGYFSNRGISWYFPMAWLLKIPLPITLLLIYGIVLLITRKIYNKEDKWRLWYFFIPVAVYWAITLRGSLNIGIRHLLPTLPFIYLFVARTVYPLFNPKRFRLDHGSVKIPQYAVGFFAIWYAISSLAAYPFYIAYFNELTFGKHKYEFLVDSNLDWGQDLKRLASYIEEKEIDKIHIDYFGGTVPSYYIKEEKLIDWHSDQGPDTGWFAVSATFFQFSKMYGIKEGKWDYSWLENYEPERIIGGSILVYNISEEDLRAYPPLPLAPEIEITPEEAEKQRKGEEILKESDAGIVGVEEEVLGVEIN